MHSDEESFDYEVGVGNLGNTIKFLLVIGFIALFAYALFSAIDEVSDSTEGIESAATFKVLERTHKYSD